jgi:hypothetical protein
MEGFLQARLRNCSLQSLTRNGFQNYVSGSRKSGTILHKRNCDFGITKETLAPLKT